MVKTWEEVSKRKLIISLVLPPLDTNQELVVEVPPNEVGIIIYETTGSPSKANMTNRISIKRQVRR